LTPPIRLLDLGAVTPVRSQALYHGLAEGMSAEGPDTIVLCRPSAPCFCVGYHQSPQSELDLAWCGDRGYPVLQRRIGGGTVFLDGSQLFYQCVFHRRRAPLMVEAIYRRFLGPIVEMLRALGLPAALEAVNEIEAGGRRIAGTGGGQIGEAVVVVGNLLLDFPAETMARAWRVPSPAFRRLAEEGLRRHLVTLGEALGRCPPEAELGRRIAGQYEIALGRSVVPGSLTATEERLVQREEQRLGRLDTGLSAARPRGDRLKLTRRAWVGEWRWPVGHEQIRVTARMVDGRVEELDATGAALGRAELERRVLELSGARALAR
jgi:lipoate-protein ligase A